MRQRAAVNGRPLREWRGDHLYPSYFIVLPLGKKRPAERGLSFTHNDRIQSSDSQ